MARFKPVDQKVFNLDVNKKAATKNVPFTNLYACAEGNMVYINMDSVASLTAGMKTLRDIALIVDISGSMSRYYKNGEVLDMIKMLVDTVSPFDDDGIDLLFFADGLIYNTTVSNAREVENAVKSALKSKGAYGTTLPTEAFEVFASQLKKKSRAGTVLFITDGVMDDNGRSLKDYYANELHTKFKTRDNFYCYAIEFGKSASGALDVLDGLYKPDQGPEDLFDLDSADNLDHIASVLSQVSAMSAVGSDVEVTATVDNNAKIDMVNSDLINGGMTTITGPINKIMSFRVLADSPFNLKLSMVGYDDMNIKVVPVPNSPDVDLDII